jgi:hypothetical protein
MTRRIYWVFLPLNLLLGAAAWLGVSHAHAQQRPRFELLLIEKPEGYNGKFNSDNRTEVRRFEVWHDRESGVEFVCTSENADEGFQVSCFPTGRNWK